MTTISQIISLIPAYLRFAIFIGMLIVAVSLTVLLIALQLQKKRSRHQKLHKKTIKIYRPLLFQWLSGETPELPKPTADLEPYLLELWNDLYEKVEETERLRLREAAKKIKLNEIAHRYLDGKKLELKILAIITLGALKDKSTVEEMLELCNSDRPLVRLQAIRALLGPAPKKALKYIFDDVLKNPERPVNYYLKYCREVDRKLLTDYLLKRLKQTPEEKLAQLLPFLEAADNTAGADYLRQHLQTWQNEETLARGLRVLRRVGRPQDEEIVLEFLSHPTYFVRIQAARVLGELGSRQSLDALLETLGDGDWWVRTRAAEALANLPAVSMEELENRAETLNDKFARDALYKALELKVKK